MQAYLQQLERLKAALQIESDTAFSQVLDVSQGAISGAKKRGQIPYSWFFQVHEKTKISIDWLYSGCGSRPANDTPQLHQEPHDKTLKTTPDIGLICPRCAKLEAELEAERGERRELSDENRQRATKIELLLRENGDLRERCATLEGQLKCCNIQKNS